MVGDGNRHGEGAIREKVWKIVKCHDYGECSKTSRVVKTAS